MVKQNILAVGAHPDDIELGCGGTLVKHMDLGNNVFVLIMTNGERGNHPQDRSECTKSLRKLGIKKKNIFFGNFPDTYLVDNSDTVNFVEKLIKKLKISRVYTHHPIDRHQDHRACSNAVSSAARKVSEIFLFQGPSTKYPFEPHYFIELKNEHIKKKIDALHCYKSQINKGIVDLDWARNIAQIHGILHGKLQAEAFAINHLFRSDGDV
jgi:N-acetylglucosamine malate deacetylase 1